jgi:predicted transcriptional regulator
MENTVKAKAINLNEYSDAIVVSFGEKWFNLMLSGKIQFIIRKRIPVIKTFKWIYAHFNVPRSSISARIKIKEISTKTLQECSQIKQKIGLTEDEIIEYIGSTEKVGCFEVEAIERAVACLSLDEIRMHMEYNPPQSFFILSTLAKDKIDQMAHFVR